MEMSTTANTTITRMNSVRESVRKKPSPASPSVALAPLTSSEDADGVALVIFPCPCELSPPLSPTLSPPDPLLLMLCVLTVVTVVSTTNDSTVHVSPISGNLCSASRMSSFVALTVLHKKVYSYHRMIMHCHF